MHRYAYRLLKLGLLAGICLCSASYLAAQADCTQPIVPDVITPNNDGINDTWIITCIDAFPDNHLVVYDRWGGLVYEAFGYDNNWDASWNIDKGALPDGVYVYVLSATTPQGERSWKGTLTIVR